MFTHFQIGETIRSDGPENHSVKAGTPTMGGVIIIIASVLPTLLWADITNSYVIIGVITMLFLGMIGFIDDYLKLISPKSKKGLIGRYKLIAQIIFGLLVGLYLYFNPLDPTNATKITIPFFKNVLPSLGLFFIPFVALVITGSSNAVNLTDGLDGLAIGTTLFPIMAFGALCYLSGHSEFSEYLNILYLPGIGELTVFAASIVGAGLGFLWFNTHPAEIFMGDTGSLALGGALGTIAVLSKNELLLIIVGGVFVAEALSVIIQVVSYKTRGKRVFKMAPLHHHFEKLGWPESKIVVRFWIIGAMLALVTLSTLKLR
jgi:phospho-N-acetylmuramoyl-pentapeptide-transferase